MHGTGASVSMGMCHVVNSSFSHRYGKFIVLDLLDLEDMWHAVSQRFDLVQGNLLADLMSKKLLNDEK